MNEADELDGCSVDMTVPEKLTTDDDIVALTLFADVDFLDPEVVGQRKAEWEALFDA